MVNQMGFVELQIIFIHVKVITMEILKVEKNHIHLDFPKKKVFFGGLLHELKDMIISKEQ